MPGVYSYFPLYPIALILAAELLRVSIRLSLCAQFPIQFTPIQLTLGRFPSAVQ
jgi:hypothetical protein